MDAVKKDKRFAIIAKDPRFHRMKRKDRKVTIDKRFHGMFNDKRFKLKYTVDKRGRPVRTTTNDHLQQYYDLSDEDSDEEESDGDENADKKKKNKIEKTKKGKMEESSSSEEEEEDSGQESEDVIVKKKKDKIEKKSKKESNFLEEESDEELENQSTKTKSKSKKEKQQIAERESYMQSSEEESDDEDGVDLARGVGNQETSSSSEESEEENEDKDLARGEGNLETTSEEESSEESEEEGFDHKWGELHYTAPPAEEITSRLAVCNMDWDRIKAQDIFVLLNSFKPTGGVIKKVAVYPSEYGKQRMAEEDVKGPKELVEQGPVNDDVEEGSVLQREKLRQYQLNRLRYYYAVAEFDCEETANSVYEQCDGIEYESSGTRVDLRFIPDGMEFDDTPKSIATGMPDSTSYKPSQFVTTALQQSKVDLTWDETDKDRTAVTMRKFTKEDLEELDMKDYLASSESENDEDPYGGFLEQPDFGTTAQEENEEDVLKQYNQMIKAAKSKSKEKKKESDVGLEISWDPGLKEETDKKILKKSSGGETPWEQYLNKKKEKKKKDRKKKKAEKGEENLEKDEEHETPSKDNQEEKSMFSNKESDSEMSEKEEADQAFSDDDLPSDVDLSDNFFKDEKKQEETKVDPSGKKKKRKGKKKQLTEEEQKKRAELALLMEEEDDNRQHFNLKDIMEKEGANLSKTKKKKLKKLKKKQEQEGIKVTEDTFKVDVSDPRFEDLFKNPHYNIDPSAPEFKATKSTDALIQEKLRRRRQKPINSKTEAIAKKRPLEEDSNSLANKHQKQDTNTKDSGGSKDHSLASLVKSVKAKTQTLKQKKRR